MINITGDKDIILNLGQNYIDNGATAIDNIDGNITKNIKIINRVNTKVAGKYKITYKVTDSSFNTTSVERNIIVSGEPSNSEGVPILMYHFFYDESKGKDNHDGNFTEINNFRQQMKYLKDNNFYFPTWNELNDYIDGKNNLPNKSVIVTADDGNSTFFDLAYPILKENNIKATSFLVTSWSGNPDKYNVDRSLISFQSHSENMHRGGCKGGHGGIFLCIKDEDGLKDLSDSITTTGSNEVFCYPFGDYDNHDENLISKAGFKMAVTTKYGKAKPGINKFTMPRIRVSGGESLESFIDSIN